MKTLELNGYTFTVVNENTEKGKSILRHYEYATKSDIFEAYKKPSSYKVSSFYQLINKMKSFNGYGMRITGAGSDQYSCAYIIPLEDTKYLVYETAYNPFIVKY